jgi:uncharacterized protein involved in exopolysaccharide biosynthesis
MDANEKENIGLLPIIVDYLRHWKLILLSGVISLIIAVLYFVLYPKTYEIMARVLIQHNQSVLSSGSFGLGEAAGLMKSFGLGGVGSVGGISIENEISTFYSNQLMKEAVTQLHLYAEYTPVFLFWYKMYGEEPVHVSCDSATIANLEDEILFKVSASRNGKIKIQAKANRKKFKFQFDDFPAVVELEQGRFVFTRTVNGKKSFNVNVNIYPPGWVAEYLADEIIIEDYSKTADVIEFTYPDHQKKRAKDFLNTLIALYNEKEVVYKNNLSKASEAFLENRMNNMLEELDVVEHKIEKYKTAHKITDVLYDIQYYAEAMKDLTAKIIEAETQANIINLLDEFVKNPENKYKLIPSLLTAGQDAEGSPLYLYNQALLERERIIKNSSTEENPLAETLTLQVDRLRESVYLMVENARVSISQTQQSLKERESKLLGKRDEVPEHERIYMNYKRQQEIIQGVYLILLQKREEIAISMGENIEKAKVLDAAFVKKKPIGPRKLYMAMITVILTLVFSIGWLFCKKQLSEMWKLLKENKQ